MRHCLLAMLLIATPIYAQAQRPPYKVDDAMARATTSPMAPYIEWFQADRGNLERFYNIPLSPTRHAQFRALYREWLDLLTKLPFDTYTQDARIDYLLLKNYLIREQRQLEVRIKEQAEFMPLIGFADTIIKLEESRKKLEKLDGAKTAELLNQLKKDIDDQRQKLSQRTKPTRFIANRASLAVSSLRNHLARWHNFHQGYDPLYSWWCEEPYKKVDTALGDYASFLRNTIAGIRGGDEIVGDPIGKEMLLNELEFEMIPYSPEQLVTIANEEFAWCEAEMKKASNEMGFGDDWKKALEHVKQNHVQPGEQPEMVKALAQEAIKFLDDHDLVTVPP
ncbi:MAG TPA: DUF885 family protein, partial [Gemmatales bacterium]|nr:DUF885 family protein [Gemmatales bacterium]